jgi:hypothetical protein
MSFDVTFKRLGHDAPQHVLQVVGSMEEAIKRTKLQYPGCLVINAILVP